MVAIGVTKTHLGIPDMRVNPVVFPFDRLFIELK